MIIIVIKEDCPRANYIVEVLFKVILKVDYRICYSTQLKKLLFEFPLASVVLYLPEEETFEVEHIRVPFHPWMNSEVLIVPENIQAKNDFFEEDIFMKCFIKLTEIENYSSINLDSHHRYEEDNSEDLVPLLHQLAYDLYDLCKKHNYILPDIKVSNSLTYSLDVDRPFVFKGLPLYLNLFGVFKLFTNKQLECVFVTRGVEMLKECAGDMIESFNFVKLDTEKIEQTQFVSDFFGKEEGYDIEFYTRFV